MPVDKAERWLLRPAAFTRLTPTASAGGRSAMGLIVAASFGNRRIFISVAAL